MKKSVFSIFIFVLISSMLFAAPQQTVRKKSLIRHSQMPGMEQPMEKMADQLKLTDAQKEQFRKIRLDYTKKRIQPSADLKLAHIELEEAIQRDDPKKEIDLKVKKINEIRGHFFTLKIDEQIEIRNVLTAEQKAMLKDYPMCDFHKKFMKKGCGQCPPMMNRESMEMGGCKEEIETEMIHK